MTKRERRARALLQSAQFLRGDLLQRIDDERPTGDAAKIYSEVRDIADELEARGDAILDRMEAQK
jgi:hypothetical protein